MISQGDGDHAPIEERRGLARDWVKRCTSASCSPSTITRAGCFVPGSLGPRGALGACTDLQPVYRRLVKMVLEQLQSRDQQIGQLDQEMAMLLRRRAGRLRAHESARRGVHHATKGRDGLQKRHAERHLRQSHAEHAADALVGRTFSRMAARWAPTETRRRI